MTAVNPDRAGAADVSFVAGEVPMIIDGIGMRGDGGHTVNETADLGTLPTQISRVAVMLYRLTPGRRRSRTAASIPRVHSCFRVGTGLQARPGGG